MQSSYLPYRDQGKGKAGNWPGNLHHPSWLLLQPIALLERLMSSKAQVYLFLNGETKSCDNKHATAAICSISQRPCRCSGEETNAKDYTRSFRVDLSHMTVSSQVKSFEFAQVNLGSF